MAPSPSPSGSAGLDLERIGAVLFAQRRVVLSFLAAGLVSAFIGTKLTTPSYRAAAVMQLLARAGKEVASEGVRDLDQGGYMEQRDRARTLVQKIQSAPVLEAVLQRYADSGRTDLPPTRDGIEAFGRMLSVGPREDTQLIEVAVEHSDPDAAALLANLTAQTYYDENLDFRKEAARATSGWLDSRTADQEAALAEASAELLAFKDEHGIIDVEGAVDEASARKAALQQAIAGVTTERVDLESGLVEKERLLKKGRIDVLTGMFNDTALQAITQQAAGLRARAAEVRGRYAEKHPERRRVEEQLAEVEKLLGVEVYRLMVAERAQLKALRRQEGRLKEELATVDAQLLERQRLQAEYDRLSESESQARRLVIDLGVREAEVDLQAETQLSDIQIISLAIPPRQPVSPSLVLNLAMAFMVSLVGGVALAFVRHEQKDALLTVQDVERRTGLPVLASLPTLPEDTPEALRHLYAVAHPQSLSAEGFRSLRTMLQMRVMGEHGGKVFLVTSGVAGEGKTTTSIGLAASFARMGLRTLLIDADLRKPRVHESFRGARGPGLADTLGRRLDPTAVARPTSVDGLFYLPAGSERDDAAELLYSRLFPRMLRYVGLTFDVVVVDSSPVGLVADTLGMAAWVDGVVVVVRRDHGPARLTIEALHRLASASAKVVGAAFNDTPPSRDAHRYGAGYYTEAGTPAAREA